MHSKRTIRIRSLLVITVILTQILGVGGSWAAVYQQPPNDTPFTITGFIQRATLDPGGIAGDPLAGGTVTVNGSTVIIPRNTIVLMPGTFLSWQELWAKAPLPWGLGGNGLTGLAISDVNPGTGKGPLTTFEITILGNCIPDSATTCKSVAGLVAIAQQSLNLGQGVINFIDYAKGELHVGGALRVNSTTDIRLQINDPVGRYSKGLSPDPRFTADTDNPTIRAKTGYPMCIPRAVPPAAVLPGGTPPAETDPLCPQRNRPQDPANPLASLGNFTLGPFANSSIAGIVPIVHATAVPASDPTRQAPFQVGDYIDYSGTLQQDATGPFISAHQIIANLGIYTSRGANPAYLAMDVTILGVGGTPINFPIAVPEEATGRIKARGFFTDPSRTVDVFAVDVNPCTGAETERPLLTSIAFQITPWGRFNDVDKECPVVGGCGAPTRQWRVKYSGTSPMTAANGLQALQYTVPVAEFIFPENTVYGDPTLLSVPLNFQEFPFLVTGEGPWRGDPTHVVGQLTPFPLTNSIPGLTPQVATPGSCSGLKPVANAGGNQTVASAATVTLSGSASSDPNLPPATPLTFSWTQTAGPVLAGFPTAASTSAVTSFKAPTVAPGSIPVNLGFRLTVSNSLGVTSTSTVAVTVTPPPPPTADIVTIVSAVYRIRQANLNVTAISSASIPTCAAILSVTLNTGFGPANMSCAPGGGPGAPATYTFTARPLLPQPATVTVKSSLGGSSTVTLILQP